MDIKHSTLNLPWIWVIETLATSCEIDTSILIDLVKQIPEISDDMGKNARELVSLRVLETLSVLEISNASNDASVPGDKIDLDKSVHCEDVLRHLLLGVSWDQKLAGPEVSKWDVQLFVTKKRSCLPKCALQQIKDTVDTTNPCPTSLKENYGFEVGSQSRDGDYFDAVDFSGIKQCCEVRGRDAQYEHVLPSGNVTPRLGTNTNGLQENQPRTLVPFKRRIDTFTAHEGEHRKTEPISENSFDTCIKASKRFKREVISPKCDAVHDFESSQRDGISIELLAQTPQAIVQKRNLENGALVGGLDGRCEGAAPKMVRQNTDTCSHDDQLPEIMILEEKIQNVGSSSKACDELRTSSGSSLQVIHQYSHTRGTEDHRECNWGSLFKDEPYEGAKRNILESDEPEFSSDSNGYHNEKTVLSAKRNNFVSSQCTQGQDALTTKNVREFKLCVKCNEGGQLLICSSNSCSLVVHQSCLGSVPSFHNGENFYCPFCAYSRAISEYLEVRKLSSLARKDLASFIGVGARRQSRKSSRRTMKNHSREDEELYHDKNNKDVLNEFTEARSASVSRNSLDGEITEMPSPQPEASVPREPVATEQKSKKSPPRSHRLQQKLSREEEELSREDRKKHSLNKVQDPGNATVSKSTPDADVTGSPLPEASALPELMSGQSGFVNESSEDEEVIASRYCVRFRNSDKNYTYPEIPQVRHKHLHQKKVEEETLKECSSSSFG